MTLIICATYLIIKEKSLRELQHTGKTFNETANALFKQSFKSVKEHELQSANDDGRSLSVQTPQKLFSTLIASDFNGNHKLPLQTVMKLLGDGIHCGSHTLYENELHKIMADVKI